MSCARDGNILQIVLATNIAETAITVDDVVFVIDTGRHKEKSYDAYTACSTLQARSDARREWARRPSPVAWLAQHGRGRTHGIHLCVAQSLGICAGAGAGATR